MPKEKFNPLDPLGLFDRKREFPLPDPLKIFKGRSSGSSNPGAGEVSVGNPIPIEWAADIIPLKTQARQLLMAKRYTPQQADLALHWAEEWLIGTARRLAPSNPELQKTVVISGYNEIASRAENWLQGIEEAFQLGTPLPV